ncbi:MAG: sulfur oxidation c-type cytochrome SoxX [Pseudooceanicola sp.]|nr:sulfur oxidation c-type cytochrome SoxX [Pseudooceanicola sp.]
MRNPLTLAAVLAALCGSAALADGTVAPGDVKYEDGAVAVSLTGTPGDPANGPAVIDRKGGNCIACHQISAVNLPFPGEIGPPLDGAGSRWTEAELRGIVANAKMMFPDSMMPSFYKTEGYIRPGVAYTSKPPEGPLDPLLSAQQIEDVVAFLMTLKD